MCRSRINKEKKKRELRAIHIHILGFENKEESSAVTIDRKYEIYKPNPLAAKVEQNNEAFMTSRSCDVCFHKPCIQ